MTLEEYEAQLRQQHVELTAAYERAKESGTRKEYRQAKRAIQQLRGKYGPVLKALDKIAQQGSVEVRDGA